MIRNSALSVACALAFVACPKSNPAGDSSKAPAQTPAQTRAPAASASAVVSIKVRGVTISFDHFGMADLTNDPFRMGAKGAVASIGSMGPTGEQGLGVTFSGDPACHYANGAVFQLTDPCIFLTVGSLPQALEGVYGVVNMCQPKLGGDALPAILMMSGCNFKVNGPIVTTGTLTLRRWSPSGPIEFSFSPGAQLTGIVVRMSEGGVVDDTVAVPVSGTVSAARD
jgi:hypothetical protein